MGGPSWGTISTFLAFSDCPERQTQHDYREFSIDGAVRCQCIQQIAPFLDRAVGVGQTCAVGAFDEFGELFAGIVLSGLPTCNLSFKIKALREERLFSYLKQVLLD